MSKRCKDCLITQPLSEYYKHKQMADGHLNKCKSCVKGRVSSHRDNNLERIQEYDRNRPNKEERVAKVRDKYFETKETDPVLFKERNNSRSINYREKNPEKYKATNAVNSAIKYGRLVKSLSCARCECSDGLQGHHWSYLPEHHLDVEWLCVSCHSEEHVRLQELGRCPDIPF